MVNDGDDQTMKRRLENICCHTPAFYILRNQTFHSHERCCSALVFFFHFLQSFFCNFFTLICGIFKCSVHLFAPEIIGFHWIHSMVFFFLFIFSSPSKTLRGGGLKTDGDKNARNKKQSYEALSFHLLVG